MIAFGNWIRFPTTNTLVRLDHLQAGDDDLAELTRANIDGRVLGHPRDTAKPRVEHESRSYELLSADASRA